jgi:hypothetical protein
MPPRRGDAKAAVSQARGSFLPVLPHSKTANATTTDRSKKEGNDLSQPLSDIYIDY